MPDEPFYEDLSAFRLTDAEREELLQTQIECTFCWVTKKGDPLGVIMAYLWRDGRVWLTATRQRARIAAVRKDPRCSIVVTSNGTRLPNARTVTIRGRCVVHEDAATKEWFYPALSEVLVPEPGPERDAFCANLDSPLRVVLEVLPEAWITCDAGRMMADSFADS